MCVSVPGVNVQPCNNSMGGKGGGNDSSLITSLFTSLNPLSLPWIWPIIKALLRYLCPAKVSPSLSQPFFLMINELHFLGCSGGEEGGGPSLLIYSTQEMRCMHLFLRGGQMR